MHTSLFHLRSLKTTLAWVGIGLLAGCSATAPAPSPQTSSAQPSTAPAATAPVQHTVFAPLVRDQARAQAAAREAMIASGEAYDQEADE
ncbi:hypothetical protein [Metallibacterium scheffleri]|uniref:hypothetical protein n=1 Tax=Metallibacterium scheffleri TaxID=993689 RepID=UPI0023F48FD3|nr:hypothetical protein [Metallibacterium scheffleri]